MNRKFCLLVLLTVAIFCLSGCQKEAVSTFVFRNGITWNSNIRDVQIAENDKEDIDVSEYTTLSYDDVSVSNYTADLLYHFESDELLAIRYFFRSDLTPDVIENLVDSIVAKYGRPKANDIQMCIKLMTPIELDNTTLRNENLYSNYVNWILSDGTFIAAWSDRRGYQILYLNGKSLSNQISKPNTDGL